MSDDTPTERFETPGDAPTERFPATPAAGTTTAATSSSRRLIIILSSVGAALLIALIILLILLFGQPGAVTPTPTPVESSSTPTPSATPTPTPTATEDAPPPAPSGPQFTNFIAPASQGGCSAGSPEFPAFTPRVKVAWTSSGADSAWYVNGSSDAADSGFMEIPLNGDQDDFPYAQDFNCSNDVNTYTITLVGPEGEHKSKTWHVENTGDTF
jgi:hypothetical protein